MTGNNLITFSESLKLFLDATGVKCRKLAMVLNFEYSTVYKWKGGQRIPPQKNNKEIINDMAELFAQAAIEDDVCNRRVLAIISKHQDAVHQPTEAQSGKKTKQEIQLQVADILTEAYQYSKSFMTNEKESDSGGASGAEQTNGKEMVNEGSMCFGIRAVSEQFSKLIKKGIESTADKSKPIIYFNLINKVDMSFGSSDGTYVNKINQLVQNGWKINISLCIDKYKHNSMDVSSTVTNFFAMVSNPAFSMDYIYMDTSRRQIDSVLIIPDTGAIISYSLEDWNGNEFCQILTDAKSVDLLYRYYQKRLESARSMYSFHSFDWYLKTMRYSHQAGEDNMVVTNNIAQAMMPKDELEHFVRHSLSEYFVDDQDMMNHINDTVKFYDTISGNSYQHIMSKSDFSDYIRNGKNNVMGYHCNFSIDQRIRHLEHVQKIVEGNTSIELLLLDDIEFENIKGMTLNMNSSNKALLNMLIDDNMTNKGTSHGFIMLTEPFVVNGLKAKFRRIWQNTSNSVLIKKGSTDWLKLKINWLKEMKGN